MIELDTEMYKMNRNISMYMYNVWSYKMNRSMYMYHVWGSYLNVGTRDHLEELDENHQP